jgi:hypothetical protein
MFESLDTARSISALRSNTIRRGTPAKKTAVAKRPVAEKDEAPVASRSSKSAPAAVASSSDSSTQRRSVFSNDPKGESDEEYRARKERLRAEERDAARRRHERGQEAKKGKILDELAGIDDEDPLSGMGK